MENNSLDEILAALELSPRALAHWLADLEQFCNDHGGERRYRELMALVTACRDQLAARSR